MKNHTFKDSIDYEDYCDDLLNDFIDNFTMDSPYKREVEDDDNTEGYNISFMFTDKGINIIERYKRRLHILGEKLFPGDCIEIKCSGIIEL